MTVNYSPGHASREQLDNLCDDMVLVTMLAYRYSEVDFSVVQTRRTEDEQRANMNADPPVSWTMDSDHLYSDEYCERGGVLAEDIYPWVNGQTNHDPKYYMLIAKAMFRAAGELGVEIKWGGFWKGDRRDYPHFAKRRST